jgi:hypothetical protein
MVNIDDEIVKQCVEPKARVLQGKTLKAIWFTIYDNNLGNHMVDIDDAIVKQCVEPKKAGPLP